MFNVMHITDCMPLFPETVVKVPAAGGSLNVSHCVRSLVSSQILETLFSIENIN